MGESHSAGSVSAASVGVGFAAGLSTAAVGLACLCCRHARNRARDREPLAALAAGADAPRELSVRAFLLAGALSVVLGSAAVYMGLFAGQSTSASIPSAVVSMSVLRQLGGSNLLENNLVQTGASSGQSVSAGLIFTLPALIMLHQRGVLGWDHFDYAQTTAICIVGGVLGICFSILVRRAMIEMRPPLRFPEAVACSQVLRAGHSAAGAGALAALLAGGALAALTKLCTSGLILFNDVLGATFFVSGSAAVKLHAVKASPALYGIGFIVGLQTATSVLLGGLTNWLIAVPLISAVDSWDESAWLASAAAANGTRPYTAAAVANLTFASKTRFIAIGMMLSGTAATFLKLRRPLYQGVLKGIAASRAPRHARSNASSGRSGSSTEAKDGPPVHLPSERDLDFRLVLGVSFVMVVPMVTIFAGASSVGMAVPMAIFLMLTGFVMAGIAAYLAGLLGFSNSPISVRSHAEMTQSSHARDLTT